MIEYNFTVDTEHSLIELKDIHLHGNINIFNSLDQAATTVHIKLPKGLENIELLGQINLKGSKSDLVIAAKSTTYLNNLDLTSFEKVLICDNGLKDKDGIVTVKENSKGLAKLYIQSLKTNNLYLLCKEAYLKDGDAKTLSIKLTGDNAKVEVEGTGHTRLKYDSLEIFSKKEILPVVKLTNLYIAKSFKTNLTQSIFLEKIRLEGTDVFLEATEKITLKEVGSQRGNLKATSPIIDLRKLNFVEGKVYISPTVRLDINLLPIDKVSTIFDLTLDMSNAKEQDINISLLSGCKIKSDILKIYSKGNVSIKTSILARKVDIFEAKNIDFLDLTATRLNYKGNGSLHLTEANLTYMDVEGKVKLDFKSSVVIGELNATGLTDIDIHGKFQAMIIKQNLNLNPNDPKLIVSEVGNFGICIYNQADREVKIDTIIAKLSVFRIFGSANIGTAIIRQIDTRDTLLTMYPESKIFFDKKCRVNIDKFILGLYDININKQGMIDYVLRNNRLLTDGSEKNAGNIYAHMQGVFSQEGMTMSAENSLVFSGNIDAKKGDIGFKAMKDISVQGNIQAQNILLASVQGTLTFDQANIQGEKVGVLTNEGMLVKDTSIHASNLLSYAKDGYVQITNSNIQSELLVFVSETDSVNIENSRFVANSYKVGTGKNYSASQTQFTTQSQFIKAAQDFIQYSCHTVNVKHPPVVFAKQIAFKIASEDNKLLTQIGLPINSESSLLEIVGIFASGETNTLAKSTYKLIDSKLFAELQDQVLEPGMVYIEAGRGTIIGSSFEGDRDSKIIIKSQFSVNIVPLTLYNAAAKNGFDQIGIIRTLTQMKAGLIDIESQEAINNIGAIMDAAVGSLKGKYVNLLPSIDLVRLNQQKLKALTPWCSDQQIATFVSQLVGADMADIIQSSKPQLNFSDKTYIEAKEGPVDVYFGYRSKAVHLRQGKGDIVIDKPLNYEYLALQADLGKISVGSCTPGRLFASSKDLAKVYAGLSGETAILSGQHVFLIADEVDIYGGDRIDVKGTLKIVGKNGVNFIPVAVHERLVSYSSKSETREEWIHQLVSEINAGTLEIETDKIITILGTIINAVDVKLKAEELKILPAEQIYKRSIYFEGTQKWNGSQRSWEEHITDRLLLPSMIKASRFYADISGKTTIEAALAFIEKEAFLTTGNLEVRNGYNIHLRDFTSKNHHAFKCHGGQLKVNNTKTVEEIFEGRQVVPTLFCVAGVFYGYAKGKMHILGSRIEGEEVYLVAPEGIKLEAAPNYQYQMTMVSETGASIGYKANCNELAVKASIYDNEEELKVARTYYTNTLVASRNNLVMHSEKGDIEQAGADIFWQGLADVKAVNYIQTVKEDVEIVTHTSEKFSAGIGAGIKSSLGSIPGKMISLMDGTYKKPLEFLSGFINGYNLVKSGKQAYEGIQALQSLYNTGGAQGALQGIMNGQDTELGKKAGSIFQIGTYAFAGYQSLKEHTEVRSTQGNTLQGGDLVMDIQNDVRFAGIKCNLESFEAKMKNFFVEASATKVTREFEMQNMDLQIPITGNHEASIGGGERGSESESITYDNNFIRVKGKLKLTVENNGVIRGVSIEGGVIEGKFGNLMVESLQDIVRERVSGFNLKVGTGGSNIGGEFTNGSRDAQWSNAIGRIIGTQVMNLVVKDSLEVVGGILARAEIDENGNLIDKGDAEIEAARVTIRKLYDYDKGKTLGAGLYFGLESNLVKDAQGIVTNEKQWQLGGAPVEYSFKKSERERYAVISGHLKTGSITGDGLKTSTNEQISETQHQDTGKFKAEIPVGDIARAFADKKEPITGTASGDGYADENYEDKSGKEEVKDKDYHFEDDFDYDDYANYDSDGYDSGGFDEGGHYDENYDQYLEIEKEVTKDRRPIFPSDPGDQLRALHTYFSHPQDQDTKPGIFESSLQATAVGLEKEVDSVLTEEKIKEKAVKELKFYIDRLQVKEKSLQGLEKEFAQSAIKSFQEMHDLLISPDKTFNQRTMEAFGRHISGQTPGGFVGFIADMAGEGIMHINEGTKRFMAKHIPIIKATFDSEMEMISSRLSGLVSQETKDNIAKVHSKVEANTTEGQRVTLGVIGGLGVGKVAAVAVEGVAALKHEVKTVVKAKFKPVTQTDLKKFESGVSKKPELNKPEVLQKKFEQVHIEETHIQSFKKLIESDVKLDPGKVKSYIKDMENRSGFKISKEQRDYVKQQLRTGDIRKLEGAEKDAHTNEYTKQVRDKLKAEWRGPNGEKWPTYPEVNPVTGELDNVDYQVHHLIPQKYNGPHDVKNVVPIKQSDHQSGIHGSNAPLNKILKDLPEKKK